MIDLASAWRRIASELPRTSRWLIAGSPLDFVFWAEHRGDAPPLVLQDGTLLGDTVEVIGEQVFAAGGGARKTIGIRRDTGEVVGYDPERETDPWSLYGSNIDSFVTVFGAVDGAIQGGLGKSAGLEAQIRAAEPAYSRSEWVQLLDVLGDQNGG
ncbi:MAG TPA: hypothetical protein PLC98_20020 [Anaerolineales bacterium]|nr:hypothetical protein [Anaerolineales bacterium]